MREYLFFQLYGPMASWGEIAVGEVRPTDDHPTKSAILGLVAGALGIRRGEEEAHRRLAEACRFAVRVDTSGSALRDYHNAQTPTGKRARNKPTRKEELEFGRSKDRLSTIQSERDYRCDAYAVPCLWTGDRDAGWTLEEMRAALQEPTFPPYLGRRACPTALPMAPRIVQAPSLREAFETTEFGPGGDEDVDPLIDDVRNSDEARIYWEPNPEEPSEAVGFEAATEERRRDQPVSRERWQFEIRRERRARLKTEEDHNES